MLNHKNDSKSKLMNKTDLENISTIETEGAVDKTRIFDQLNQEYINYMLSKIPRNLFTKVEKLASMVSWIVSDENSFTIGAVFDLSGERATY